MRILVTSSLYPPSVGGAPALVQRLAEHLVSRDNDVEVVVFGAPGDDPPLAAQEAAFDRTRPYRIHRVPARGMSARPILAMTSRIIALVVARAVRRQGFEAIVSAVAYPCSAMARLIRIVFRTRYVVYAHGEDVSVVDMGSPRAVAVKTGILAWSLRGAHTVFANSSATAQRLLRVEPSLTTIEVLPPTIDANRFVGLDTARTDALRAELGLDGRRVLLTVARLTSPRKGHDVVVRSLDALRRDHPDVHYLVVGLGDQAPLRALAESCGVEDRMTILESVTDEDLPHLMSLAEVYVMPSRWDPAAQEGEGFGIVYLEAAAAGKPTVAGDTGGAVDAVVDGVTGLTVPAESVDAVGGAIAALLDDPARAGELGAAGRRRVVEEFSSDRVLPRLDAAVRRRARLRR